MKSSSRKVIFAALVGNALIAISKFIAAAVTGSSAMFSEGIHSLVDTGNQILLLHGIKRAARPASPEFPFGHGKELYFWSFIVALLIFALGAGISIYQGLYQLVDPQPMEHAYVNYIVLGLAVIFEGFAWAVALIEFSKVKGKWGYVRAIQRGKDPTLFVVLFEDSAALLGLLVALLGVGLSQITGNPVYDGIASVVIGCILAVAAIWLAYETKSLLIGESANKEVVQSIRVMAASCEEIEHVNDVLTMHMGPDFILVNLSVDFDNQIDAGRVEQVIALLSDKIKSEFAQVKKIYVEARARAGVRVPAPNP